VSEPVLCLDCYEPVLDDDRQEMVTVTDGQRARSAVRHWECAARSVVGSVGHQLGLCPCNGGPGLLDDPDGPNVSKRYAAYLALLTANTLCLASERGPEMHARVRAVLREGALQAMRTGWNSMDPDINEALAAIVTGAVRGTLTKS
jgi:hypothetical protein